MPFMAALPAISAGASILGKLLSGGAKGASGERASQNDFQQRQDQLALSQYGTQQNALLQALLAQDRGAMDRYGTQQAATTNAMQGRQSATTSALNSQSAEGLQRAQLGLQAPSVRARQSILGSLMKNAQPLSINAGGRLAAHKPTITGGLSAATLDPTTRQHGDALMQAALQAQLSGSDVPAATDFMGGVQDWGSSILQAPASTDFSKGVLTPPTLSSYREPGKLETGMATGGLLASILGELLRGGGGKPRAQAPLPEDDI